MDVDRGLACAMQRVPRFFVADADEVATPFRLPVSDVMILVAVTLAIAVYAGATSGATGRVRDDLALPLVPLRRPPLMRSRGSSRPETNARRCAARTRSPRPRRPPPFPDWCWPECVLCKAAWCDAVGIPARSALAPLPRDGGVRNSHARPLNGAPR
jgi:hypothetical protein